MVAFCLIRKITIKCSIKVKEQKMSSLLLRRLHLLPTKSMLLSQTTTFRSSFCSSSSSSSSDFQSLTLTESELTKINNLIPGLCSSNELPTALRLTTTALLTNPSLSSLNLSPLINSLTSHTDLTHTMSLLTHLFHTPQSHHYIPHISLMLINSYLETKNSSKLALKLLRWLHRPNSPCSPDITMYRLVIAGLCRDGLLLPAVNAFRHMVGDANLVPCPDSAQLLYQGLLTEARVDQAMELNAAYSRFARDIQERDTVLHVLDRIIADLLTE